LQGDFEEVFYRECLKEICKRTSSQAADKRDKQTPSDSTGFVNNLRKPTAKRFSLNKV
jgi:hypothetical protein